MQTKVLPATLNIELEDFASFRVNNQVHLALLVKAGLVGAHSIKISISRQAALAGAQTFYDLSSSELKGAFSDEAKLKGF